MSKITDDLDHALDKADAVLKAREIGIGSTLHEHTAVLAQLVQAVKELDARLDRAGL